jgi:DNA-binding MarR family transcriptional regulator
MDIIQEGLSSATDQEELAKERERLGWMLEHLHGLASAPAMQRMAHAMRGGEMSFSQLNAIYQLYRSGPLTIGEIAKGTGLSHNAASRMVERLVQGGLVERNEVPTDHRQKRVELTSAGIERLAILQTTTANTYIALLTQLPVPTLQRLAAVMDEIIPYLPVHPIQKGPTAGHELASNAEGVKNSGAGHREPTAAIVDESL